MTSSESILKNNKCALAIFIEPTPYILGFILELHQQWGGQLDVIFLKNNYSQNWNINLPTYCEILSDLFSTNRRIIYQKIQKKKYALIHLAGWGEIVCLYVLLVAKLKKIPIALESDTQLQKYTPRWQQLIKKILYQRMLYPILFKLPNILLPGGTRQVQYFKYYGVSSEKLVIAQMTVDVQYLQQRIAQITPREREEFRHDLGIDSNNVIFLYVGRFLEWKGIVNLITAFKTLDSFQAKLWLVGDGELQNYVQQTVNKSTNMHYFGRETSERLVNIYYAADVFVLPSTAEPWGLVVNEAMATENALIVSDNAGCVDDLVLHEKTGLLVPSKNVRELASAMQRLLDNPVERLEFARNGKEHIASWTLANEANNVIRAWQRIIA